MMHQHKLSRSDDIVTDIRSAMYLFWDLEASSCALYQHMAVSESDPLRAEAWRRLEHCRLLMGDSPANHSVYLSNTLLASCREMIRQGWPESSGDFDPLGAMMRIMQLKFLQVTLVASLRQQTSLVTMIHVERFETSVGLVTHLVLSSRGC